MKKTKFSLIALRMTLFLGLCLIATFTVSEIAVDNDTTSLTSSRSPTSFSPSKVDFQHSHENFPQGHHHTMKLTAPVSLELIQEGESPIFKGESFTLKATIKSKYDLEQLEYNWVLPDSVQMQSGVLKQTLLNIQAGVPIEVSGVFVQSTDTNEQIHFRVKSLKSNLHFGLSTQFNTFDQNEIDASIAALKERATEDLKKQKVKMIK